MLQTRLQLVIEGISALPIVADGPEVHVKLHEMLRFKSGIDGMQIGQTANKETGADEQEQRECNLRRYQEPSEINLRGTAGNTGCFGF